VLGGQASLASEICWEPAVGAGDLARGLRDYFAAVVGSDLAPQRDSVAPDRHHYLEQDFLFALSPAPPSVSHIITNPPYAQATEFALRALALAPHVALLVRTAFLEGVGRHRRLFARHPPHTVAQFVERVPMISGRLTATGSTLTAYAWIYWRTDQPAGAATTLIWIPPCRHLLEQSTDYPTDTPNA